MADVVLLLRLTWGCCEPRSLLTPGVPVCQTLTVTLAVGHTATPGRPLFSVWPGSASRKKCACHHPILKPVITAITPELSLNVLQNHELMLCLWEQVVVSAVGRCGRQGGVRPLCLTAGSYLAPPHAAE